MRSTDSMISQSIDAKDFYFSQLGDVNAVPLPGNDLEKSGIPKEALIMNFAFQLEDKGSVYIRRVYNMFDFISHIGGLVIFLLFCAYLLLGNYASESLLLELSRSIFR